MKKNLTTETQRGERQHRDGDSVPMPQPKDFRPLESYLGFAKGLSPLPGRRAEPYLCATSLSSVPLWLVFFPLNQQGIL